jgi:hypothetical protein
MPVVADPSRHVVVGNVGGEIARLCQCKEDSKSRITRFRKFSVKKLQQFALFLTQVSLPKYFKIGMG